MPQGDHSRVTTAVRGDEDNPLCTQSGGHSSPLSSTRFPAWKRRFLVLRGSGFTRFPLSAEVCDDQPRSFCCGHELVPRYRLQPRVGSQSNRPQEPWEHWTVLLWRLTFISNREAAVSRSVPPRNAFSVYSTFTTFLGNDF